MLVTIKANPILTPSDHYQDDGIITQQNLLITNLGLTGLVFGQERTPDLNKGLIFLYQRDLIVTGNFWNIVVNLDLKWYCTQLELINLILRQVETFQENLRALKVGRYVSKMEISYLYAVWEQLNSELADVEKLLPMTRRKRGLLNFSGDVLNFLFGTATSTEMQVLHQAVENIKEQQMAITHSIEHQLTYTKELDENVRQNTRDVTVLARILKLEFGNLMKLNETVEVVEERLINRLE
jgi:hypothetical protein